MKGVKKGRLKFIPCENVCGAKDLEITSFTKY